MKHQLFLVLCFFLVCVFSFSFSVNCDFQAVDDQLQKKAVTSVKSQREFITKKRWCLVDNNSTYASSKCCLCGLPSFCNLQYAKLVSCSFHDNPATALVNNSSITLHGTEQHHPQQGVWHFWGRKCVK